MTRNSRQYLKWAKFYDKPNKRTAYMARLEVIDFPGFKWEWVLVVAKIKSHWAIWTYLEKQGEKSCPIPFGEEHPTMLEAKIRAESWLEGFAIGLLARMRATALSV